jgi:hypothetical protein
MALQAPLVPLLVSALAKKASRLPLSDCGVTGLPAFAGMAVNSAHRTRQLL